MTTLYINPEYRQRYDNWVIARDLYEGRHEVLSKSNYLWYHGIEQKANDKASERFRAAREERTRYLNLSEILISIWQSLFFRQPPKPDKVLKALLDQHGGEQNIDGQGTSLYSFIKNKVLVSRLNYGKVCILADSFPIQPRNLAEQQENNIRPYLDLIWPLDAVDWCVNYSEPARVGKFDFFRHTFYGTAPRSSSREVPQVKKYSRELKLVDGKYTVEQFSVSVDKDFRVITEHWDAKTNSEDWQNPEMFSTELGDIPISVIDCDSWLKDANEESLRFFNLRSNKDNILHQQGYQDKYIIGVSPNDKARINAFNEYSFKMLPEGGDAKVLEPIDPSAYERAEQEAKASFFQVGLNKLRLMPNDSKETQAADATDKENEYTYAVVESELQELEDVCNDAIRNYGMFATGKDNFEGKIELNKQITPESFQQFIEGYAAFKDILSNVDGVDQAVAKKVVKRFRLDEEDEAKILKAIDSQKDLRPNLTLVKGGTPPNPINQVLSGQ